MLLMLEIHLMEYRHYTNHQLWASNFQSNSLLAVSKVAISLIDNPASLSVIIWNPELPLHFIITSKVWMRLKPLILRTVCVLIIYYHFDPEY